MNISRAQPGSVLLAISFGILLAWIGQARAAVIPVPNGSFESPVSTFVEINFDSWQKTPKPDGYIESGGFLWTQLTGLFKNTAAGSFDHIDNCDGNQAMWIFAVPGAGLFQDYDSLPWDASVPPHTFDVKFEIGLSYQLTVGMIAGGGGMSNGATAEVACYYRDLTGQQVTVGATTITNSSLAFTNRTQLIDVSVEIPVVKNGDPWAGQHLGVRIQSTVTTNLQGGYWDFDNVRLSSFEPAMVSLQWSLLGPDLRLSWESQIGYEYQVQLSPDLSLWQDLDGPEPGTGGALVKSVPPLNGQQTFARVKIRQLP